MDDAREINVWLKRSCRTVLYGSKNRKTGVPDDSNTARVPRPVLGDRSPFFPAPPQEKNV